MATTKKTTKKKENLNFYLSVAEYIKNNHKLPDYKSKQAMNYYLRPLKVRRVITKIGYGVWSIDWDKFVNFYEKELKKISGRKVKKTEGVTPFIRGHGYHFYVKTRGFLWHKILKNKSHTKLQNGVIRTIFMGNKVWFGDDFIKVYFPEDMSFMGGSAEESYNESIYYLIKVLRHIEHKLGINIKINKEYAFRVDKSHYAKIQDAIAKECNKNQDRIHCVLDGKEWFVIDNSFNLNEAETTGYKSKTDMDSAVIPTFNSIKEYADSRGEAPKFTDIAVAMNSMKELLISQSQQISDLKSIVLNQEQKIMDLKGSDIVSSDKPNYIG